MSKNKNDKNQFDLEPLVARIGLTAMSIATLAGLVEVHETRQPKLVNQLQPAYAYATENNQMTEPGTYHETIMRREKDEIKHTTVSYGVTMRSHPVTGKA